MSDSHSDIEDELLALAGGGDASSDDEGSRAPSRQRSSRSRSRSQSARPIDDSPPRSAAAKKMQSKKRRSSAESEDEGEASDPGTPNSQQSVPMDESDSDDDDVSPGKAMDDEENKYPVDGLYVSNAEKRQILSMREVEREQIIAERTVERDRLRQKLLLQRLVSNNEDKQKKRKGGDADLEESQRKKPRASTKTGLDALKRARAEKSDRRSRRDNERRRERSPSYRSASSRSRHSDDSDVEWASSKKKRSKTPEEAPFADLRDIERCRLSRTRLARVAFYPGLDEALKGCYVRIAVGPDPVSKVPIYRMAVIKGFSTGRPYAVENERGKSIVIDSYVVAAHGKAEREWPWIAFSESSFAESEWNRYQAVCKNEGVPIPRKPELVKKTADINNLLNREWKEDEVQEKIKQQNKLMDKFNGVERARVEQQLAQAQAHENEALVNELQDKLDRLPMPRLAFQTSLKKNSPIKTGPTQQDRLAEKNALNRQLNAKNVREAQLAERRRAREIQEAIERGEDVQEDLSRRVKTKVKFMHRDDDNDPSSRAGSGANTPAGNGTPKMKPRDKDKDEPDHIKKLKEAKVAEASAKGGVPMIHKVLTDDDIIGALDLDIDVTID